ncbi:MAG: DNA-directed RNA polymerase subunit omega [Planctomycetaceae bacterium]|nr:DNA-directed RNA polymerase subunit omega [Planctomycetaceae bacterium]
MHYPDLEMLYEKHGGKFRVAVLLQRRVQQLVRGDKKLVAVDSDNPMDIAVAEARAGKIWLDESDDLKSQN